MTNKKPEHYDVDLTKDGLMEKIDTVWYKKLYLVPFLTLKYILWERWRVKTREKSIGTFMTENKRLLVIVCDPQTDKMMMSYKGQFVVSQIKKEGKRGHIVRKMLKYSQFKNNIDGFIQSLSESLLISIQEGNQFFQWVDGAIYNIAKILKIGKQDYDKEKTSTKKGSEKGI